MKSKSNQKSDRGITLIALIITIILLVILAAITIRAMYNSRFLDYAINGALGYATEQNKELNIIKDATDLIGQITGEDLTLLKPTVTLTGTKGNENVYSSDVVATIKDSLDIVTMGKIEIHYIIEGLNEDKEESVQGRQTSVTVTEEGRYKIKAWIQDGKGNKSEAEEIEFIIDKSKPGEPRISLTGTEGDNEYYIDKKVGVTIEAGTNITSGVSAIKYRVEGAGVKAETTEYTDTVNFEITVDGESTIYAKIINNAGVVSDEISRTLKKDSEKPNVATLTYNTCDTATITVTANGQDVTSKVASYIFEKSIDNVNFDPIEEVTSGNGSIPYTYKGLKDGTKYYLRVTVKDNAGLMQGSNVVEQTTVLANSAPSFTGTPTVAKVENSNTSLTITAKATDPDGDNLTYTLCDQNGNAITTNVGQTTDASGNVVFTHSGLGNYSTHTYIVKVTDGKVAQAVPSSQCEGTTYCKGYICTDGTGSHRICKLCYGDLGMELCVHKTGYSGTDGSYCSYCGCTEGYGGVWQSGTSLCNHYICKGCGRCTGTYILNNATISSPNVCTHKLSKQHYYCTRRSWKRCCRVSLVL